MNIKKEEKIRIELSANEIRIILEKYLMSCGHEAKFFSWDYDYLNEDQADFSGAIFEGSKEIKN